MVTLILTLNIQDKIYLCLQKRKDEEGAMDDSTLIEQIQLGSKNAFKQMFIKFYSPLCEYASQYVSDEDAEELIQELMLFIWENRNSLFVEISLNSTSHYQSFTCFTCRDYYLISLFFILLQAFTCRDNCFLICCLLVL